jgi:Cu-processing system ATP-binding protein
MSETVTVRLDAVSKHYGAVRAVDGMELTLHRGQCVALVGHNGAGKSTLIKLMLGLIRPSAGRVDVLGADATSRAFGAVRGSIGFLPENVVFPPAMTGAEVLAFYARLKRQPVRRNAALLERIGLADAARRRVGTYSKGMRQRLGLAQALIGAPSLLLLDEPTSGLDPALRQDFYEIIGELARNGATVLLSSHALAEIEHRTDRVIAMDRGRKIADGTLADLRRLSGSPTRIRIRLPEGVRFQPASSAGMAEYTVLSDGVVEIRCLDAAKLTVLRQLLAMALPLADIDIISPTLDDIYADVLRSEAAE